MKGPIAIITGGSRGIGRGIALELAKLGWNLGIHYAQNQQAAQETKNLCLSIAKNYGHEIYVHCFQAHLQISEQRKRFVNELSSIFSSVDMLVNNAGVAPKIREDMLKISEEAFSENLSINLIGPFFLTQEILPLMLKPYQLDIPYRSVVFITSISAYTASTNRAEYCIAKSALSMAAKLYAVRLAEFNIRVFEIRPGIIATDMTAPVKEKYDKLISQGLTLIRRWGTPEDIGRVVASIARGDFLFSTGMILDIDGGFHIRIL